MHISEEQWRLIQGLPGEELIREGLRDLAAGHRDRVFSLFILQARERLILDGLTCLEELVGPFPDDAHIQFYRCLERENPDEVYQRYNSLNRRLCSFSSSLMARVRRQECSSG